MSENKASFPERTIRSLKNILYRYMKDNGSMYTHKLTQFVITKNSGKTCPIDLIPKNVRNSTFRPFFKENHYENLENPRLKLETEFASRSMFYLSGSVISHNLHRRFSKLLQFLAINLQHTQ